MGGVQGQGTYLSTCSWVFKLPIFVSSRWDGMWLSGKGGREVRKGGEEGREGGR